MKRLVPLFALLPILGSGCGAPAARPAARLEQPRLQVTAPLSGSTATTDTVAVTGETNMPTVSIDGEAYPITQSPFRIPYPLHAGQNTINVSAGNGYTTTSMTVLVTSLIASSTTSTL